MQLAKEEAESERLAQLEEQERRDHELALRLATETNSAVEEMTPSLKRCVCVLGCEREGEGVPCEG